ncbi:hypothetical protein [Bacillus pseudomycoides]|uniref:hypothetical protein n=1 Tax=Bacillus pseudomycoides TaxID=64104 RepID=UPI000BF19E28|nr:hypothetical protein [Bacillus pseudomycoides]PEM33815.1 hypothetical protein CN634_28660 [Bacillus pseudomycoides]
MKKKILIGVLIVIVIIGVALGFLVNKANNMKSEFTSFREELDNDFFPLLKDTHKHFETAIQKGKSHELSTWYTLEGMNDNLKYNRSIKEVRDKIVNIDVKNEDTIKLQKNVLNSLSLIEKVLSDINVFHKDENSHLLWGELSENMAKLKKNVDKQNEILGKYYD